MFQTSAAFSKEDSSVKLIRALLDTKVNYKNLKVKTCPFNKEKWILLLLSKKGFTESINFSTKCDIKGKYSPKREVPFPVKLQLRKIPDFSKVDFNFLINLSYTPSPKIKVSLSKAKVYGKKKVVEFSAQYSALIDPFTKGLIKEDLGGQILIKKINGKLINKTYPLKMKKGK